MKVLLTGATGFVGANLARRLVQLGAEVHIFAREESNLWRIADLLPHLHLHTVDLSDGDGVFRAVTRIKPEKVCHLATFGGHVSQNVSNDILGTNFLGLVHLLRACTDVGFDAFINTGSSSEYGIKTSVMREDDLLEPIGDYGVSKAAATLYCRSEALAKGLPIVTLRLFSPFGPWDSPSRLISYTISSCLRRKPLRLIDPRAVRDYIYIKDVVDLYVALLQGVCPSGEIFNVGSGKQQSVGEVVKIILQLAGTAEMPVWGTEPLRRPEPPVWIADLTKIRNIGWEPKTPFLNGLEKTMAWMAENLELYS